MHFTMSFPTTIWCYSVCHHGDDVYVGVGGGVDVFRDGECTALIQCDTLVFCVRIYEQRLYLLVLHDKWYIREHKLNGELVRTWTHRDNCRSSSNQFAILDHYIYIPNKSTNTIQRYSLEGDLDNHAIGIYLSDSWTSLCATRSGHLILSQLQSSRLVCINPQTGEQLWSRHDLVLPAGVTSDNQNRLIVSVQRNYGRIFIVIREDSGKLQFIVVLY